MRHARRGAITLVLLFPACTGGGSPAPAGSTLSPSAVTTSFIPAPPSPTATASPSGAPAGESAAEAMTRLCVRPPAPKETPASPGPVPPAVREVERQVQEVRGLEYLHPVAVDAVTHDEIVKGLAAPFDHDFPSGLLARRTRVWQLIGVIPEDAGLREVYQRFLSQQVIGYYAPTSGQLVFLGTTDPSPVERLTLAHELTHADDDQHFDLSRLNGLENRCRDEELMAATGAVEGSAQFFSFAVAREFFTPAEQLQLLLGSNGGSTEGIPPFIQAIELWPYLDGENFIAALDARGGLDAVNAAFRDFPVSTEQVMHPEKYPGDVPTPVDVPDYGPALGAGWRDLDVMQVGEEWLKAMLELRVPSLDAANAAAGWDGGLYRAWTNGPHVAVVLSTRWDSEEEAGQFAAAVRTWVHSAEHVLVEATPAPGSPVAVLFASDAPTLDALERAAGFSG